MRDVCADAINAHTAAQRSLYESVARRRADVINQRLLANVRQLEQVRQLLHPPPSFTPRVLLRSSINFDLLMRRSV
jgi:hypothetical protein